MAQLLSPVVHAGMQARMAADPILYSICVPDSTEGDARASRLIAALPDAQREQLAQQRQTVKALCQLSCGVASGAALPPSLPPTAQVVATRRELLHVVAPSTPSPAVAVTPPATGPPA